MPNGKTLTDDPRCAYRNADFFALARGAGFDPEQPGRRWDAVLLDIDHTPSQLLNPSHADFYSVGGLRRLKNFLKPGGVFAMWSNDDLDAAFLETLRQAFGNAEGRACVFDNPLTGATSANSLYLVRAPEEPPA